MKAVRYHGYGSSDVLSQGETELGELVAGVDRGELRVHVAARRPLAELAAVHAEPEAGRLRGKTVLTPA
ncbi:zinc-binding dehydrogenase [Pseudonocardia sp. MH-G8]|uniref:zinc-binding dehydrogenase n=1 Tax=Pseudonocardia sp. MH-G8 TaxID=1854588 RepID=UPI002697C712